MQLQYDISMRMNSNVTLEATIGLKQPRNNKFKIDWAQAFSTYPHLKQPVHFISDHSFKMHTNSES